LAEVAVPKFLARSYLFVPGNRPERFAKAYAAGADAVIVDLEDAVPPTEKATARAAVAAWLAPERPVLIRINSAETEWFDDDLALCGAAGVAGIVLPKAERVEQIAAIKGRGGTARQVLPLVETAQGFSIATALARCEAVQRVLFGSIDFQVDLGIDGEGEATLFSLAACLGVAPCRHTSTR
jgi:citrate lyase subunit beta/citryl-CoA lyase